MRQWRLLLGLFLLCAVAGCVEKVTIRAVEPGAIEITDIKRLAVIDLHYKQSPDVGRNLANVIVAELNRSGSFEVMERSAVEKILQEQKFGTSGLVDAQTISSLGKLLGVDAVIVGEVLAFDAGDADVGRKATVGANVRVVSVESAKVVFSDSISENYSEFFDAKRKEAVLNELSAKVAKGFVGRIAPHYVEREKFLLATAGKGGRPNGLGMKFAKNNLWDKAQEQFEAAANLDGNDAAIHNNLAVCHERFGRLREAIGEYEKAIQLNPDDESVHRNLAGIRGTFREHEISAKDALESVTRDAGKGK
ncbi:MAG: CsgG/HfaB family protein [Planctomycetota bacterium]